MSDEISRLLKGDLARSGLTQEEFAKELGLTQQAISAWLARNAVPHRRVPAIERVLGVDSQLAAYLRDIPQEAVIRAYRDEPQRIRERPRERLEILGESLNREHRETPESAPTMRAGTSFSKSSSLIAMQAAERRFYRLIENVLPDGRVDARAKIGTVTKHFDYLSEFLCVELLIMPSSASGVNMFNPNRVYQRLITLLLLKQTSLEQFPDRHYAIIILSEDPNLKNTRYFNQLEWECEQFDMSLSAVPTAEEAADLVIRIEGDASSLSDHDYDHQL